MSKLEKAGCTAGGCVFTIVAVAVAVAIAMLGGALGVAAAKSWFFAGNFSDGWSEAWARPLVLLGWTVLFYGIVGSLASLKS